MALVVVPLGTGRSSNGLHHRRVINRRSKFVICAVVVCIVILVWLLRLSPWTGAFADKQAARTLGETASGPVVDRPYTHFAEQRRVLMSQPRESKAGSVRYSITGNRKHQLEQITGKSLPPVLGGESWRATYTVDDILEMFPYLRTKDGMVRTEELEKLRGLLIDRLEAEKAAFDPTKPEETRRERMEFLGAKMNLVGTERERLSKLYNVGVNQIIPKQPLLSVSPKFSELPSDQMGGVLGDLARAQTLLEEGVSREKLRASIRSSINLRHKIQLSDEQADQLLDSELRDLAVGIYWDTKSK